MDWFSLAFILFLIMDPFGNITSYLSLVKEYSQKRKRAILVREMLIALGAMTLFSFIGEYLFHILEISEKTIYIGSGIILFLVALKILFPTEDSPRAHLPEGEPFIVPLAIPLIAGPSLLTTIMLFSHIEPSVLLMLTAIFSAWLISTLILYFAPAIQKIIGSNGLMALERLMGMILILIAIQRFLEGVHLFIKSCHV